ncbi:RcpC/CpaB family pilus assembly protein [Virgibacillus halodenitrificans]|uniref:RcpC/CpaB family pilus assembly protein n=1 Tax=Virgibacillus halodenitrificans TaxID=1482 RepID=UPI000EF4FBC3|nr:RcpC/CpaB family pilus assembly protein [Virgibacillus halodenitrificans]
MNKFFFRRVLALIVAAIAVVAVYFYTNSAIETEVNPTKVVITTQDIPPHSEIKAEMVQEVEVPRKALGQENPYAAKADDIVGKWTVEGYGIPAKGFINTKKILPKELLPDSGLLELQDGEYAFSTQVDLETSHGNTIKPGTKVDLYLAADFDKKGLTDDMIESQGWESSKNFMDNKVFFFGRVAADARVVEVKDNRGNKVFTPEQYTEDPDNPNSKNKQQVAKMYTVAVNLDQLQLVNKASLIGDIVPIVSGTSYNEVSVEVEEQLGQEIPDSMSDIEDTIKVIKGVTLNPQNIN